jgi:hypothetical protein
MRLGNVRSAELKRDRLTLKESEAAIQAVTAKTINFPGRTLRIEIQKNLFRNTAYRGEPSNFE